jgi:peptidoglycan-associated lipoprotein
MIMSRLRLTCIALTVMVLGACSQGGLFPNGSPQGPGSVAGAGDPTSAGYFQTAVGDRVLFAVDQHTLTPEAQTVLAAQAAWLTQNAAFTAIIEGHADEQGTREYNLALGARRATAARDYLVSRGVAPDRLRTVTFGKERPIEICSNEACYAQNRRAVTVLQGAAGL